MGRDRTNANLGPSVITLTNSATSAAAVYSTWIRWGQFRGSDLYYTCTLGSATSGQKARLQGRMSSASTKGQASFALSTGAVQVRATTAGGVYCFVRAASTVLAKSQTATFTFAAVH